MCSISAHQKYWLNGKSLQLQRITAEKNINSNSFYPLPRHYFFSGKESFSRFVQGEMPIQIDRYIARASTCSWGRFVFLNLFSALYVLPGGQYLLQSMSSGTVVPSFLGHIHHAKKGVEGWAPAIFLASGVVAPSLEGWVAAPGSFYSAEFCNPPLRWKLQWVLLGTQQATFQLNEESRKFSSDTFIPSWLDKFAKLKTVRKRGSFAKVIW